MRSVVGGGELLRNLKELEKPIPGLDRKSPTLGIDQSRHFVKQSNETSLDAVPKVKSLAFSRSPHEFCLNKSAGDYQDNEDNSARRLP